MNFSWTCPFCNRTATITENKYYEAQAQFDKENKYGEQIVKIRAIISPNDKCREYALSVALHDRAFDGGKPVEKPARAFWRLIPLSDAKPFPTYVPGQIRADYKEMCLIVDRSPRASATLGLKCLQEMIHDFWGVKKASLIEGIAAIKDKVEPLTWRALESVLQTGNLGDYMKKDADVIVDVGFDEAKLLIELIQKLLSDWYITKYEREQQMNRLIETARAKKQAKPEAPESDETTD
jgi:hypothetical protein